MRGFRRLREKRAEGRVRKMSADERLGNVPAVDANAWIALLVGLVGGGGLGAIYATRAQATERLRERRITAAASFLESYYALLEVRLRLDIADRNLAATRRAFRDRLDFVKEQVREAREQIGPGTGSRESEHPQHLAYEAVERAFSAIASLQSSGVPASGALRRQQADELRSLSVTLRELDGTIPGFDPIRRNVTAVMDAAVETETAQARFDEESGVLAEKTALAMNRLPLLDIYFAREDDRRVAHLAIDALQFLVDDDPDGTRHSDAAKKVRDFGLEVNKRTRDRWFY